MRRSVIVVVGSAAPLFALPLVFSVAGCPLEPFPVPLYQSDAGTDAPPGDCASASDCPDDGNPCTNESCVGGQCSSTLAEAGSACPDANLCNGLEVCNALGQCVGSAPVVVDDGDACTTDACDAATGNVSHTPISPCGPTATWTATAATSAPLPRQRHTAVWTGSKMIVWGGSVAGAPSVTATGAVYDPQADTWTPTSATNAPPPRHSHRAVWTGSKMIVWGGYGAASYENTGGVYDPASDTWTAMSTAGAPSGRTELAMVWADASSTLAVWGGFDGSALGDGGIYDPAKDAWTPIPLSGAPGARLGHSGVWTGSRAIFWGGNNLFDWQKSGALLVPGPPTAWLDPTDLASAPGPREGHTALWTGTTMLIWGGWNGGPYLDDGAAFDPSADADGAWSSLTTTGAPSPRTEHTAVWTGSAMMVWGGCGGDACVNVLGDGGLWSPGAGGGAWKTVPEAPVVTPRQRHTAVWTGKEVIVWGGKAKSGITATGARFVP